MPIEIKILKSTPAQLRAKKNWRLKNPDYTYEFDHKEYYHQHAKRRNQQSVYCRFVKAEFQKFRNILLEV